MEKSALEKLKSKFIFSIEGNAAAGKTTLIGHLKKTFKDAAFVEEPVNNWQNLDGINLLEKKNEDVKRWGYTFQVHVHITKMNELVKVANTEKNIILVERSKLTDKAFFDINVENNLSTPMEEAIFKNLYEFLSNNVFPKLTGIIYLDIPIEECMKRMKERGRKEEELLSVEYIKQLDRHFKKVIKESGLPVLYLNGKYDLKTELPEIEKKITNFIKEHIK